MRLFLAILVFPCFIAAFPLWHPDPLDVIGPWHRRSKPCKVPTFIDELPAEAADKIRDIWKNYVEGNECVNEHKLTREVLRQLTSEEKEKAFSGRCGPSFLRNVSSTVRKEFRAVWFDHKLNAEEKEVALQKLAYSLLSGESLALFNNWKQELQTRKKDIAEKIANLSPEAKTAYNEWKQLRLTERKFLAGLSKEVRSELTQMFGFGKRNESTTTTNQPETTTTTTTTTTTAQPTTEPSTTTVDPIINEETKEKEFYVFLHSQTLEQLNSEDQCDFMF